MLYALTLQAAAPKAASRWGETSATAMIGGHGAWHRFFVVTRIWLQRGAHSIRLSIRNREAISDKHLTELLDRARSVGLRGYFIVELGAVEARLEGEFGDVNGLLERWRAGWRTRSRQSCSRRRRIRRARRSGSIGGCAITPGPAGSASVSGSGSTPASRRLTDEGYVGLDVHRATRVGSAGHGVQTLLSEAARGRVGSRLPAGAAVQALGVFALKGLPGVESLSQLTVPDLPATFPPLRLEKPARVGDDRNAKLT